MTLYFFVPVIIIAAHPIKKLLVVKILISMTGIGGISGQKVKALKSADFNAFLLVTPVGLEPTTQ